MIKIFPRETISFETGQSAILPGAYEVQVERTVNEGSQLSFRLGPAEASKVASGMLAVVGKEAFRVVNVRLDENGSGEFTCREPFFADGYKCHIPTLPDAMGADPSELFAEILEDTIFEPFSAAELSQRGLTALGEDGFLMDFWGCDKTTPPEAALYIIEQCGRGEIYTENFRAAIVERVGSDRGLELTVGRDIDGVLVEEDTTELITRLYPYGEDDLPIEDVYLDSPDIEEYGLLSGYKNYDISDPDELYNRALWEFDEDNPFRIDRPDVTVSGDYVQLEKLGLGPGAGIGDTVAVSLPGFSGKLRVASITEYPYEGKSAKLTLGRIKKDLFFYFSQMGMLSGKYKRVSSINGDIKTNHLSGVLNTETNNIKSGAGTMTVVDDLMTVRDSAGRVRIRLGNSGGRFEFVIYDENGSETITLDEEGSAEFSGRLTAEAVFSGSIKTSKDAEIGRYLKLKGITGSGQTGGIQFVDASGNVVADILLISGSNGASYFVIESSEPTIINNISIVDLAERVAALEGGTQ